MENHEYLDLLLAAEQDITKLIPMKRFGFDFKIKTIDANAMKKIQDQATRMVGKGKTKFDTDLFNYLLIAEACVVPNWKDPKVQEALEVPTSVDAIKKRLLFGEVATLMGEISELNGIGESDEDTIDSVKN